MISFTGMFIIVRNVQIVQIALSLFYFISFHSLMIKRVNDVLDSQAYNNPL